MKIRSEGALGRSSSRWRSQWVGLLVTIGLLAALSQGGAAATASSSPSSVQDTCVVSEWGPFTPCTRTGLHHWAHSHSRKVQQPASDCPTLVETETCKLLQAAPPVDAATAAQQVTTSLLINLPLALSAGISFPQAAVDRRVEPLDVTPELAATLIEGKQLWQQQASHTDALQCSPFNGPADLLRQAAAAPIVGAQSAPSKEQMAAAGAAFAAAAKAVAMQSAAAKRSHANSSSIRGFGPLQAFRKAVIVPTDPSLAPTDNLVPSQSADATASVTWDGSNSITVGVTPGAGMDATAAHTSGEALQDGMRNMVPWMQLKAASSATQQQLQQQRQAHTQPAATTRVGSTAMHLNMTYDHSERSAIFNAVPAPTTGLIPSHGMLLLSIQHYLTGIYGLNLDLDPSSSKPSLLDLPVTDAMLRATAGGGVDQLGVSLAGTWTQANLTAAMGLSRQQRRHRTQQQQQDPASFTITEPAVLFSAVPAALYVAVQTNVPSLAVVDAPATINLRPGGAAALQLFEPCEPVAGLQLTDVQLHLQPQGNLTGIASGRLASTPVSALATVTPFAAAAASTPPSAASGPAPTPAQDDLAMVMAAEMTVAAGDLADVITIITHRNRKAQPVGLLQALRRQQDQQRGQRMQFSSVTLTYNSPKASRRRDAKAGENIEDGGGFNMVAVPDVNAAPVLKQMLDAVGLNQDSLTLRTSSASNVGTAFALAAEQPYRLQLPAPFTAMGPTVLTLEYDKKSVGSSAVLPADTLISTALAGASTGGLQLPGSASPVAVDLSAVKITTPTAIVGTQGGNSTPQQSAQVTAEVSGTVLSQVSLEGLSFLSFGPMNVSGKAGYEPMTLQELELSGALTAFGVAGTASFVSSGGGSGGDGVVVPMPDAQQADAGVSLLTYVPSVDLPLMAQSLGANLSLGVISANVKNMRAQFSPTSAPVVGRGRRARAAQDATGGVSLSVSGELQILGMSSYVSFDMSGEQGASIAATFVAGQINKVMMPGLLSAVSASLQTTRSTVQAAVAAAASAAADGQVTLQSLLTDAQAALKNAQQRLDAATGTLNSANKQATTKLRQAAATAESATAAFHAARSQSGAALAQARNELNTADTAFNQAKTIAYKNLNTAQQAYRDALAAHEAVVKTAQDRVDTLVAQTLQLRADYNMANLLCNPTSEGLEHCKTAAAAWVAYQSASSTLDSAQTALQEAAVAGSSASNLDTAQATFAASQAAANDAVTGEQWAAWVAAAAKLDAATTALAAAERGPLAAQMHAANADLVAAQDASRTLLSPSAAEWKDVLEAKHAVRAARAGVRAATAAARLTTDELSAASSDLNNLLTAIQAQQAAAAADNTAAAPTTTELVRFERINIGFTLVPDSSPALLGVSYSGAVGAGDQQQALSGRFMVDASVADSEEFGLMLSEVLRDDALIGLRKAYRSLSALL